MAEPVERMTEVRLLDPAEAEAAVRARRREFTHASPGLFRLTGERSDAWRDFLYAATVVLMLSSIRAPHFRIPIFVPCSIIVFASSYRSLARWRLTGRLFVFPLACFLAFHLYSAFRLDRHNGMAFVLQAVSVMIFVISFVNRYSQISMMRFLRYSGIGYTLLLIYVVGWHILHHRIVSYKDLSDSKAVFDVLPIMLVVLRFSKQPRAKLIFTIVAPLFILFLLLSGERKAYILLAVFAPLLINFKSPVAYMLPVLILAAAPFALSLEKNGYVARQLNTLEAFAQGKVTKTYSNELRQNAIHFSWELFKQHPATGVGTNGYAQELYKQTGDYTAPHNEWMRVLAENGVIGFTFYAWTVLFGLVGLLKRCVWGRVRSRTEQIIAGCLFVTLVMYISFEALDFIVITAFVLTPFVQYLRLDPNEKDAVWKKSRLLSRRAHREIPQASAMP